MCWLQYMCKLQPVCELCPRFWMQRVWRRQLRHAKLRRAGSALRVVCSAGGGSTRSRRARGPRTGDSRACGPHDGRAGAGRRSGGIDAGRGPAKRRAAANFPAGNAEAGDRAGVETDPADRHPVELDAGAAAVRSARPDGGSDELFAGQHSSGGLARSGCPRARQRRLGAGAKLKSTGVPETPAARRPRCRWAAHVSWPLPERATRRPRAVSPQLAESRQFGYTKPGKIQAASLCWTYACQSHAAIS